MGEERIEDDLYNEMKARLAGPTPCFDEVKETAGKFLEQKRAFPADLRFQIWEVLLDVSGFVRTSVDLLRIERIWV